MFVRRNRKGTALLMSMILLAVIATWAVAICSTSGTSVQLAVNQQKADGTRACAESGLEIIRCWLSQVTPANLQFSTIASSLKSTAATMSNVAVTYPNGSTTATIPTITLDAATGRNFGAVITLLSSDANSTTMQITVTGNYGTLSKAIRANYIAEPSGSTIFDFGIASKGPVSLSGNVDLEGVTPVVECYSNMYIESDNSNLALTISGNADIGGDVSIANPSAYVSITGNAEIGGETGNNAIKDHVKIGVPPSDFPTPNPGFFKQLVTLTNLPAKYSNNGTFTNVTIPPNTNPSFSSQAVINGLLVIEPPNRVNFSGGATINGIIVGDGDMTDDSQTNQITFSGNVNSSNVTQLPSGSQFDPLRNQTGTFIMAPGFAVSFSGNFSTINGTIAANGVTFSGNAGGTINGSIINYSQNLMPLSGNSTLKFNRSGASTNPAGFVSKVALQYDPTSYAEGPF